MARLTGSVSIAVASWLITGMGVAGGMAPATVHSDVAHTSDTTIVGHLSWEITETSSSKVLGKGSRDILANEVGVIASPNEDYLEQRVTLSDGFYLKLNSGRSEESFSGFGLAAGKDADMTFSWEWFVVDEPGQATKLQETGALEFKEMLLGNSYEIIHTKFLTNISMRVMDAGKMDKESISNPPWRVMIFKDSYMDWPTYAGGKVRNARNAQAWYVEHPPAKSFWQNLVNAASDETTATKSQ